jgi:hypothetical protein
MFIIVIIAFSIQIVCIVLRPEIKYLCLCLNSLYSAAEHYTDPQQPATDGEQAEGTGFVSLALVSLPMAKLVPILSGLLAEEGEEEEWLSHLIGNWPSFLTSSRFHQI